MLKVLYRTCWFGAHRRHYHITNEQFCFLMFGEPLPGILSVTQSQVDKVVLRRARTTKKCVSCDGSNCNRNVFIRWKLTPCMQPRNCTRISSWTQNHNTIKVRVSGTLPSRWVCGHTILLTLSEVAEDFSWQIRKRFIDDAKLSLTVSITVISL